MRVGGGAKNIMNNYEIDYCSRIMKKMYSMKVSPLFFETINSPPKAMGNSQTNENRLTFAKIQSSLFNNLYTKEQWIKNMRTLFQTVKHEYREESIVSLIASDLSDWFEKKIKIFPKNQQEEWLLKLAKAQKEAAFVLEKSPLPK